MREAQRARGEKTLYDGRWRPEPGKTLPPIPEGVPPVIRFRNPQTGVVQWDDLVKGPIAISNHEIDDLVIVRADGIPTYNFAVVVDDWDMRISHVFRGDEHVNNTPWQINIFRALGAPLPAFAHVPIILGERRPQALEAARRGERHRVRGARATCPRRCSTISRASAGAMATRRSSRASKWSPGSTAATSRRARRSGTRPSSTGSTRTT